jgi:hypothetical protein
MSADAAVARNTSTSDETGETSAKLVEKMPAREVTRLTNGSWREV